MPPIPPKHTLLDPAGRTIGLFVPIEEWERLLAENERLRAEAEAERREREEREERIELLDQMLGDYVPTPPTPEEMEEVGRLGDNSHVIREIVAKMYRDAGVGDGNR